jgi:hypothetical protein
VTFGARTGQTILPFLRRLANNRDRKLCAPIRIENGSPYST